MLKVLRYAMPYRPVPHRHHTMEIKTTEIKEFMAETNNLQAR